MDTSVSSLMDQALVSVMGVVDSQMMPQSPGLSVTIDKKKKVVPSDNKPKVPASKLTKTSSDKPAKSASDNRSAKFSADTRIESLTRNGWIYSNGWKLYYSPDAWIDLGNRPFKLSRSPVGSVKVTHPIIKPVDQPKRFVCP